MASPSDRALALLLCVATALAAARASAQPGEFVPAADTSAQASFDEATLDHPPDLHAQQLARALGYIQSGDTLSEDQRIAALLAGLSRSDSLVADIRLSLALLYSSTDRRDEILGLLPTLGEADPASWCPADLRERCAVFEAGFFASDSPERAAEALRYGLSGDTPGADWCATAQDVGPVRVLAAALCDDTAPDFSQGPAEQVADALLRLGRARYRRGDGAQAREALRIVYNEALAPIEERCEAAVLLGRSEERTGATSRALGAYEWVLEHCGAHDAPTVRALFGLGRRCAQQSDRACAERHLDRLIGDYPTASHVDDALTELGEMYRQLGEHGAALGVLERALAHPVSGDMWRDAVWRQVMADWEAGDSQGAREVLARAVRRDGWNPVHYTQGRFRYHLGRLEAMWGDLERASSLWRAVVHQHPLTFYARLSCDALERYDLGCSWPGGVANPGPMQWPVPGCLQTSSRWRDLVSIGAPLQAAAAIESELASCALGPDRDNALWLAALLLGRGGDVARSHDLPLRRLQGWQASLDEPRRWTVAYPTPFHDVVVREASRTGVPEALIYAVMRTESGFRAPVHSYAGAQGLMQVMPSTARGHVEDVEGELTVDNAGSGSVRRWTRALAWEGEDAGWWVEHIGPRQTRHYTIRVMTAYLAYSALYSW